MLSMAWGRCHSISELGSVWETNFQTLPCCFGFKVRLLMNFCQKATKRAKLLLKLSSGCRMVGAHQQWPSNYGIHASVHFSQSLDLPCILPTGQKRVKKFYLQIMPIMQKWPSKNMLDDVSCKFKLFENCWISNYDQNGVFDNNLTDFEVTYLISEDAVK